MSEFSLLIHDIDESGKSYEFELTPSWLETTLADAQLRPDPNAPQGSLRVHAQKNDPDEYLVDGHVQAALVTECGRCLGVATVPVDTRFTSLFSRGAGQAGSEGSGAEHELDDEDDDELSRETFSGNAIVLDPLIREYLVLEVPMQPLCSPDCKGIAVPKHVRPPEDVFGPSDAKVDPRLAPLLRLRDKIPPNKE
ncbi:MAG TPA: DUF177 domain-containing protein [Polyangiales bacterium]|nr:DUF177 domain-containing protein [Polyangiales bacterium]